MSELRIIELDPTVWLRGKGDGALLDFDDSKQRKQCCIGVACTVFGIPDGSIRHVGRLDELDHDDLFPKEFQPVITTEDVPADEDTDGYERIVDRLDRVYTINDSKSIADDAERVRDINAELEKLHAPFRFSLAGGNQGAMEPAQTTAASAAQKKERAK